MAKKTSIICVMVFAGIFAFTNYSLGAILWSENWDTNPELNWSFEGNWQWGVPTVGPSDVVSSPNCAATNLNGNYPNNADYRLIKAIPFEVPPAGENPRLEFWHWYDFGEYDDYGQVQIKVGSDPWEGISNPWEYTSCGVWTRPVIDLSRYAGQTVQIGFYFHSDWTGNSSGWYIDNVCVKTGPVVFNSPEGWETGLGDWSPHKGAWEVGAPTNGPGSAYEGDNCAATVLDGNYCNNIDSQLVSPPFTVPPVEENPALRFRHWYDFGEYDDYGQVQIRVVGSDIWNNLSDSYQYTSGGQWAYPYLSLSDYAGQTVQIGFYFHSDWTGTSSGWYIDNVEIHPLSPPEFKMDIKVNGSDGTVVVGPGTNILVTVELEDGAYTETPADWWIGAVSTIGTYWYNSSGNWVPSNTPILYGQDPLHDVPETIVLDTPLPVGIYTFFFVLDDNPDGIFNITVRDHVNVFVRKP